MLLEYKHNTHFSQAPNISQITQHTTNVKTNHLIPPNTHKASHNPHTHNHTLVYSITPPSSRIQIKPTPYNPFICTFLTHCQSYLWNSHILSSPPRYVLTTPGNHKRNACNNTACPECTKDPSTFQNVNLKNSQPFYQQNYFIQE